MSFGEGEHLNGEEAKAKAGAMYGAIRHPTIDEIVLAVLEFWEMAKICTNCLRRDFFGRRCGQYRGV